MTDALLLYTHPMSRGRVARWMLEEVGQPYDVEMLEYGAGTKSSAFRELNPMGKVPTLRHRDMVVTECAAICAYLADAFPAAGLAPPPGNRQRGAYYRWLFFAAGPVEAVATNKALGVVIPPERKRMTGFGSLEDVVETLDGLLTRQDYVAGDRFSAADLYLGSQIGWSMRFGTIERRPSFERYWSRISDRPAAVRACEIDDALLPPEQRMGSRS